MTYSCDEEAAYYEGLGDEEQQMAEQAAIEEREKAIQQGDSWPCEMPRCASLADYPCTICGRFACLSHCTQGIQPPICVSCRLKQWEKTQSEEPQA